MPPAIAVVAIAAGAAAVAGASALAIAGVALAAGAIFSMMKQSQVSQDGYTAEPSGQTLRSSKAAARYIVGRISTGGVLQWAQEQAGGQTDNEWLHLVYTLSEGAIAGVDEILLNDQPISSYGSHASYEVIINPTTPNAFLLANCPDWRESMIGEGLSFVRVSLKYSNEKFPSGIPDAKFIVRGRTDIYDPRTGNTGYSDNCALIALWYLRTVLGVPDDELVMESFIDSANICIESVSNPDGSGSARYVMGAVIGDDERRGDVLKKIEAACGGKISRVGGRWMMRVGAYYGPANFTITEDMVIGAVQGSVEVDNDSAINTITGLFVDPETWAETDYPPVQSAAWLAEDGEELSETLDLKYVTNPYQAQRLADIVLRMRRTGGGLKLPLNFAGYNCRPGRPVMVSLPSLNMAGEFIVTDWSMVADSACSVTIEPYGPEIFDDQAGREYTPIGFIDIPVGGVAPPTGLAWDADREPEVRQGVLSWTPPYGEISYYGVVIRDAENKAVQTYQVPGATSNCQVQGLPAGNYAMSVYASSANGRSAESTISVAIMGPPQPQSVSIQEGFDSITLIPFNITGLNGGTYEYWYALTPTENPEAATYLGRGGTFTHTGLAYNTVYHYYVRTVNAYGTSAFFYRQAETSSDPELILQIIAGQISETELGQHLADRIDLIDGNGPGSVNERISEAVSQITDALAYAPDLTYADGDVVRGGANGRRLYQALQAVPINTPPPNAAYWLDIGQAVETANGLAVQVEQHTVAIGEIDGKVTAQASTLEALQATYRDDNGEGELADALRGAEATAQFAQEVRTRA
ncbi:fibronectin type III domain-containing protein, partial [Pseudomonas sp. KSR10]|uniref:phage tail tip protein J-related protein n=1 Tax=Pseudomonas sp. KSR10 TaxID=2916654 RepID=UPI001EF92725